MQNRTIARSQQYLSLAETFLPPGLEAPRELVLAYTRLFLTPGKMSVPLHESVYIGGRLMGETACKVARRYAKASLQINTALHELPDHLALELAFMAHLMTQEDQDHQRAEMWREYQRHFLGKHLARWLPKFCRRIIETDAHPHYRQAALAAHRLIKEDLERLKQKPAKSEGQLQGQTPTAARSPGSQDPAETYPRRYPNIQLGLNASYCTMCTLCTDNCSTGALTITQTSTELTLLFNPAPCNGCRTCVRFCPEGAMQLHREAPSLAPMSSSPTVIRSAGRVVCPKCNRPHIALPWLERLAIQLGDGEDVRRSLALCPLCKTLTENNQLLYDSLPRESYACD